MSMKNGKLTFLLCSFLLFSLATGSIKAEKISIWKIDKEDGEAWILGSIHALKPELYPLPQIMTDVVSKVDTVAVEINLLKLDQEQVQKTILATAMYDPLGGHNLLSDIHPVTLKLLEKYLKSKSQSLDQYRNMRPWFLNVNIGLQELIDRGFDPALGIDMTLTKMARNMGVDIVELESFQQQMKLLSREEAHIQDLNLRSTLDSLDKMDEFLEELINFWEEGDADGMLKASLRSLESSEDLESSFRRLIDTRNLAMAKKIQFLLDKPGNLLIVVGALHLGGEQGLLSILDKSHGINQLKNQ